MRPDPRAAAMSEAQLQAEVADLCRRLGIYHFHPYSMQRSEPGWPDSTIIGRTIIYRELKSQFGRLTREQTAVGYRIQAAGGNFKVWRPSDLLAGTIAAELTEVAGIQAELFSALGDCARSAGPRSVRPGASCCGPGFPFVPSPRIRGAAAAGAIRSLPGLTRPAGPSYAREDSLPDR